MAKRPARVGDLVLVVEGVGTHRGLPAVVIDIEASGWRCVQWDDGEYLWFPQAKLQVISRGYEKDEGK